jgi:hypothetical protein
MAYIIAEPCVSTKGTACVDICPCDCIHPRKDEGEFSTAPQLCINPDECIDAVPAYQSALVGYTGQCVGSAQGRAEKSYRLPPASTSRS